MVILLKVCVFRFVFLQHSNPFRVCNKEEKLRNEWHCVLFLSQECLCFLMKVLRCHWRPCAGQAGQLQSGPKCILCGNKFARGGPGRLIFTPECILDVTELTSRLLLISEDCQPVMLCPVSLSLTHCYCQLSAFPDNIQMSPDNNDNFFTPPVTS